MSRQGQAFGCFLPVKAGRRHSGAYFRVHTHAGKLAGENDSGGGAMKKLGVEVAVQESARENRYRQRGRVKLD